MSDDSVRPTDAPAAPGRETAVLCYDRPFLRGALLGALPMALIFAVVLYAGLWGLLGTGAPAVMAALLVGAGVALGIERGRSSTTVTVDDEHVSLPRFLWWRRKVELARIARFKIGSEWGGGGVLVALKGAEEMKTWRKRFFTLQLKEYEFLLPGDRRFQAEVVNAILARRPGIPVDEKAGRLLLGELPVELKHRFPVLLAAGGASLVLLYCLAESVRVLSPVIVVPYGLAIFGAFTPFASTLARESEGRAALASLGLGMMTLFPLVAGIAMFHGGLEYMPLAYAATLALTVGAFASALPWKLSARAIAAAEAVLLAALVCASWALTLRDTIPVREALVAPPAMEVSFSPSGRVVVCHGYEPRKKTVHFVHCRSLAVRSVPLEDDPLQVVPVDDERVLWVKRRHDEEDTLRMFTADGERRDLFDAERIGLLFRSALSPDGRSFAFVTAEGNEPVSRSLAILDVETFATRQVGLRSGRIRRRFSLTWRRDGRLVWAEMALGPERPGAEVPRGKVSVFTWAPGETGPRVEFESREEWSDVDVSPNCRAALATVHGRAGARCRIVDLSDGRGFDLPRAARQFPPHDNRRWSADGRILAFVPEEEPRVLMVARTDTGEVTRLYESLFGEILWVSVSPDGGRVAFSVGGSFWRWVGAVYIMDVHSGAARRIKRLPLVLSMDLAGVGVSGWSPSGDVLAMAICGYPSIRMHYRGESAVWLVPAGGK